MAGGWRPPYEQNKRTRTDVVAGASGRDGQNATGRAIQFGRALIPWTSMTVRGCAGGALPERSASRHVRGRPMQQFVMTRHGVFEWG